MRHEEMIKVLKHTQKHLQDHHAKIAALWHSNGGVILSHHKEHFARLEWQLAGYAQAISQLEQQRWRKAEDELPSESREYLVIKDSGYQGVLAYSKRHKKFNSYDNLGVVSANLGEIKVIAWKPLPVWEDKE